MKSTYAIFVNSLETQIKLKMYNIITQQIKTIENENNCIFAFFDIMLHLALHFVKV